MTGDAAGFVGTIPEFYDAGLGPVLFVDYARDLARRAASGAPRRVLELAAGTGIATRQLRDLLPAASSLTATDLNPPMLEIARGKFGAGESVELQPADAMALPFPAASFDAVVCQFGVMFFPDKDASYREVRRVLAPGGRYLFNVWDSHLHNPFGRIGQEIAEQFFPADPPPFYRVPFGYCQIDVIREALIHAGFRAIRVDVVRIEKQVPDFAAFARGLVLGNPMIDQIRARGGVDPERVVAAVEARLHREFDGVGGTMPLQALVFEANRGA